MMKMILNQEGTLFVKLFLSSYAVAVSQKKKEPSTMMMMKNKKMDKLIM